MVPAVALIAAACSSSSASAPTKASFDKQANAICRTYNAKLSAMSTAVSNASSVSQVESGMEAAITDASQMSARLKALPEPAGERATLDQAFAAQDAQLQRIKGLFDAVEQNDNAKVESGETALNAATGPLDKQFDALGLGSCGGAS